VRHALVSFLVLLLLALCPADFTNLVSQMHLQDLAEADAAKEQVQQVQVSICLMLLVTKPQTVL
jgi:hypothetical protein